MGVPDEVRRTVLLRAPRSRVWSALTQPEELLRWFPTQQAEMDLRPGGSARFVWEDSADEAVIEVVEPEERLRFHWRPTGLDRPFTVVTFVLRDVEGGTELTLTETGFAGLPDQIYQSYEGNDAGWASELEELRSYVEGM